MRPMSIMSTETDRIAKTVLQMMTNRGDRRDIGGRRRTRKIRSIQK